MITLAVILVFLALIETAFVSWLLWTDKAVLWRAVLILMERESTIELLETRITEMAAALKNQVVQERKKTPTVTISRGGM